MPFYRKPRNFTPLCIISERKSIKNHLHHSIFTSRFDKFVGEWKNDLKHDVILSKLKTDNGISEENKLQFALNNNTISGKGLFLTIGGKLYEGDWFNGYRHGYGTLSYRLSNGTFCLEYRGDWIKGKPDGVGWYYYKNGDVYFGFWKRGHRQGYGNMWYTDGTLYVGYWNMGSKEGLGMFVQGNGNRYEGNWKGDKKNGLGRFYHMNTGQLQEGCWLEDVCIKSKVLDINVRQFCDLPTQYPIPPETLQNSRRILEESKLWLSQRIGHIDKQLQNCID